MSSIPNQYGEYPDKAPSTKFHHIEEPVNEIFVAIVDCDKIYGVGKTELSASMEAKYNGAPDDSFTVDVDYEIYKLCKNIPNGGIVIENIHEVDGVYKLKPFENVNNDSNKNLSHSMNVEEWNAKEIEEEEY